MFKQEIFNSLIAWIGGVGLVQVITEYLKKPFRFINDKKLLGYVLSVIVSFAVTGLYLCLTENQIWPDLVLYGIPLWVMASGLYDIYHTPKSQ
jgi:hypothetical protein